MPDNPTPQKSEPQALPKRIQGARFATFIFDDDLNLIDIPCIHRSRLLAECDARHNPDATVVDVSPREAMNMMSSPRAARGALVIDETKISDLARQAAAPPRVMRKALDRLIKCAKSPNPAREARSRVV